MCIDELEDWRKAQSAAAGPSPPDRVRAMKAEELLTELVVEFVRSEGKPFSDEYKSVRAELLSRLSRVEELQQQVAQYREQFGELCDPDNPATCPCCERAEASESRQRVLEQALRDANAALKEMAEWHGGTHDDDCPLDDTCDCSGKPFNDRVNAAINNGESALAQGEPARTEEKQIVSTELKKPCQYCSPSGWGGCEKCNGTGWEQSEPARQKEGQ